MSSFYLMRHGQCDGHEQNILATEDARLTKKGEKKALNSARELKDKHIDVIFSSPLARAMQTAEIVADEIGYDRQLILQRDGLLQRNLGELTGTPMDREVDWYYLSTDEIMESRDELFERTKQVFDEIKTVVKEGKTVLAVGHGSSTFYVRNFASGNTKIEDFISPYRMTRAGIDEVEIV